MSAQLPHIPGDIRMNAWIEARIAETHPLRSQQPSTVDGDFEDRILFFFFAILVYCPGGPSPMVGKVQRDGATGLGTGIG